MKFFNKLQKLLNITNHLNNAQIFLQSLIGSHRRSEKSLLEKMEKNIREMLLGKSLDDVMKSRKIEEWEKN